jgi:hypothetical protein
MKFDTFVHGLLRKGVIRGDPCIKVKLALKPHFFAFIMEKLNFKIFEVSEFSE